MWYLIGIVLTVVCCIVKGACGATMWRWFVVPLGVPSISIAQAIGISMICTIMIGHHSNKKIEGGEELCTYAFAQIVAVILLFAVSAIVNCFM